MKDKWKQQSLRELGFVGRGKSRHRPRNDARLYGGSYPFIQTADIMSADPYIIDYSQTYSEFGFQQSKFWPPNTLCITIAGANTAKTAILKFESCFPDSIIGFIPDETKANLYFVKYSLDLMKDRFRAVTRGATQDNLSLEKLLYFPILTPPISIQSRIADVLSAYDDLIASNNQRMKILDQTAQRIYREWFIDFRFPKSDSTKFINSEMGKIPEGWRPSKLHDLVDFVRGVEPGSKNYKEEPGEGLLPFNRVGDLGSRNSAIFVPRDLLKGKILCKENIVVTFDGTVGIVKTGVEGGYSTGIRKVVIKNDNEFKRSFLYYLLLSDNIQSTIKAHSRGTTIMHAGSAIENLTFLIPDKKTLSDFDGIVGPTLDLIQTLNDKNSLLKKSRDMLMPKLVFGELDVPDLDMVLKE